MKLNGPNGESVELNKNSIKDGTKVSINQVGEDELEIFSQYNTTKDGAYTLDTNELSAFAADLEEHDLDGNIEVLSDEDIDDILKSKNQTVNDENREIFKQFFTSISKVLTVDEKSPDVVKNADGSETKTVSPKSVNGDVVDEVTVQSWGTKDRVDGNEKANDCLDRIIENYYPDAEPYSKEFLQIREAVMDANPQIYGKRTKAVSGGKIYTVSEDTKHNTILYAGDKIKLVDADVTLKPATPKPAVDDAKPVEETPPVEDVPPVEETPEVDNGAKNRAAYWQQQDEIEKNALSAIVAQTDETVGTQYQYTMEGFGLKGLGQNVKNFVLSVSPNWGDAKYPGDDASFDELESYYKAQAEAKRNALSVLIEKAKDENTLNGFGLSGKTAELTSYLNGVSPNWGDRPFNPPKE